MKFITMKISILLILVFSITFLFAQPSIEWQKCLGGSHNDHANSIQQTVDGGYIVAGYAQSNDIDVSGNHSLGNYSDYWIVKLASAGSIQWQKCLGGSSSDFANSIQQTTDGGYIIAGTILSNDSDVIGNHGSRDYWVVKLDSTGYMQWQKCLGGSSDDFGISIKQTTDEGYIVAGFTQSNNGDVTGNHSLGNYSDYWIVKLTSTGSIQWQKCLGGSSSDLASTIQLTTDGGYIIAGTTQSNDGDVTGNHGINDCWVVKLDSTGYIQWQKCLGGSDYDGVNSIQQTTDGGFIVAGNTQSNDGDVTGNHGINDSWVVKLTSTGSIQWQKCLGGSSSDYALSIQQTTDRGYIVAGYTESNDGDVTGNHGYYDCWAVKLDSTGYMQWQKCLGGSSNDYARSIQQTTDGGYIIAGETRSNDGDVIGNHNGSDYWVVKLTPTVGINETQNQIADFQIFPNPLSSSTIISFQCSFSTRINIEIRDIEGRIIKNINVNNFSIGTNEIVWDATCNSGGKVNSRIYFITIISDNFSETKKIIVLGN